MTDQSEAAAAFEAAWVADSIEALEADDDD